LCDGWYVFVTSVSASIDGGAFARVATAGTLDGGARWQPVVGTVPLADVGPHEVAVKLHVEFWSVEVPVALEDVSVPGEAKKALMHACDVTRTAKVQVTDKPGQVVRRVADAGAADALRRNLAPLGFRLETKASVNTLTGQLAFTLPPSVSVAFAVNARVSGREYPLGTLVEPAAAGSRGSSGDTHRLRGDYDGPQDITTIDLVLRPDEAAARRTVSMDWIWEGELTLKDVPLTVVKLK
jgi:hypothetical protein